MGWDFTMGATKKDIIADLTKETETSKCLAHCTKGNVLWTVHEYKPSGKNFIGCFVLGAEKGFGWGYKAMEEAMGPYYYSCPLKYLDMAPEASADWRAKVRKYHATASIKLKVGDKVKLKEGCSIPEVTVTSVKPLLATYNGKTYKLPKSYIDSVVA